MKIYIDFDGVIFDSEELLLYNIKEEPEDIKIKHIQNIDWEDLLNKSPIINNSIEILKLLKKDISILTKIHSMENEGVAKIKKLRELGINNDIILVPFKVKKTDVVNAYNNMLIDDAVYNLDDWKNHGGIPIFFNKDNYDIDNWNKVNINYKKIKSLDFLKSIK